MNLNFEFDPSDYDESYTAIEKPKKKNAEIKSEFKLDQSKFPKFEPEDYESKEETHPFGLQYAKYTPEEYEALPAEKKKELQEYSPIPDFFKGLLSEVTLGATEYAGVKPEVETPITTVGRGIGAIAPISLALKAVALPFKLIGNLTKFAPVRTAASALSGALYGTGKETVKAIAGEEFDISNVAQEAALFGGLHALGEAVPAGARWLKSLNTKQRTELATKGFMPENMNPGQYLELQNEVIPEMQEFAKKEFQSAAAEAQAELEAQYAAEVERINQEFSQDKALHQNKMRQVASEHEAKIEKIQAENKVAQEAYDQSKFEYDRMRMRQDVVGDAIQNQFPDAIGKLQGRVSKYGDDIGFRPAPNPLTQPTLRNEIGNIFSPNEVNNYRSAGQANVNAIRANDAMDYQIVNEAYDRSRQLNATIELAQPNLVNDMRQVIRDLDAIPKLSPPQEQKRAFAEKILQSTAEMGPEGTVIGFKPINNNILAEQAKAIRYTMDFNFEHGNTRGIFNPLLTSIEDSIDLGARFVMNEEASIANKNARSLYRQWAEEYDNDYIRPFRDTSNKDYNGLFKKTLNPDTNMAVEQVLNKSNAGQQVAMGNKREMVEKHLKKFFDDPKLALSPEFNDVMKELRGVISPEQESQIMELFRSARRKPLSAAKKVKAIEEPKAPKLKELPETEKVPLFKKTVELPEKPVLKPSKAMKAAEKKMKRTSDQIMKLTDSPEGLREMKESLPKELFDKISKDKAQQIFYKGKVKKKLTGSDVYESLNSRDNYEIISELFGEEAAAELLDVSESIAGAEFTAAKFKKLGGHLKTLSKLKLLGIL